MTQLVRRTSKIAVLVSGVMLALAVIMPTAGAKPHWYVDDLPPTWEDGLSPTRSKPTKPAPPTRSRRTASREDFSFAPQLSLGLGAAFPDVAPVDVGLIFGKWFRLRMFWAPPVPFRIRVEMPSDVISTNNSIGVANPDFLINLKAVWGPSLGAEALVFPFGGSFFIAGGVSHRELTIRGSASSPILICSLAEAAQDPPCGRSDAALVTRTKLGVSADARSSALLLRTSLGGFWEFPGGFYLTSWLGTAKPTRVRRSVKADAKVESPAGDNDDINTALAAVRTEKARELEEKAKDEIAPHDQKRMLLLGVGMGWVF